MYIYPAPNIDGDRITVTSTANLLFDLINTAASTSLPNAGYPHMVNGFDITVLGDDINMSIGNTPTATKGITLYSGNVYHIPGVDLSIVRLITTDTDSVCAIAIGKSEQGENFSTAPSGVVSSSNTDNLISTTPVHASVSMTDANTEYTYTLPTAVKSFEMRLDIDSEYDFKLNYNGSVDDSATDYIPSEDGEMYWRGQISLPAGFVLRFQCPEAAQTMRIVTYS